MNMNFMAAFKVAAGSPTTSQDIKAKALAVAEEARRFAESEDAAAVAARVAQQAETERHIRAIAELKANEEHHASESAKTVKIAETLESLAD